MHSLLLICTDDVAAARDFYVAVFGFRVALPAGAFARVLHVGPFETLGLAYHALHAFAQERGHERRGPMREIYVNDPADVAPEAIETEVWMPL